MKEETDPRRESWLGNNECLDQILRKIFQTAKKPRKVSHWGGRPGNWPSLLVFCCKWTTKRYKWFSSLSDWSAAQISVDSVSIFVSSLQPSVRYTPCLNCLRGPVWLSHNKTAPALDAAQTTSLGYKIISRRRSVQTFPRPRPKILTSPCYFRSQLQQTSGIPRELTNEDVVISTSANCSTVIVQLSTSGNLSFGCHPYHWAIEEGKLSWNILLYAGQSLSRCPLILQ